MTGVKFRGLDPRTRLARWGLLATAVGIALGGTLPTLLTDLDLALATHHDNVPWYAMRLLGLLSYLTLSASVVYGLLMSTRLLDAIAHRPITFALHQDLASVGLGLAGVHGMLLALDRVVPFTLAELLVPGLSPYRPLWVAAGQLGFYLATLVVASFYLRRRIGQRLWRTLHALTFAVFAAATLHGFFSGTDTTQPWAWGLYGGVSAVVVSLVLFRVIQARSSTSGGESIRGAINP